jgi:predicted HTH domain antitoxin
MDEPGVIAVDVAIQIPDDIGRALAARSEDIHRAVLEAVAIEAYRAGAITTAQVQEMLGFASRWVTETFLANAGAFHEYTTADLEQDIQAIRDASNR